MNIKKNLKELILAVVILLIILICSLCGHGVPCVFEKFTGLLCPGCGITRMFLALLSFDFVTAFYSNQLVFILLCLGIMYYTYAFICFLLKKECPKISNKIIWLLVIIVILYGILRNIPGFEYLRPR